MSDISNKISIATTSLYSPDSKSNKSRAKIALETVKMAIEHGYEINIVDGGSSEEIVREYINHGANVFRQIGKTMGEARRQAIVESMARSREIIVSMEAENVD